MLRRLRTSLLILLVVLTIGSSVSVAYSSPEKKTRIEVGDIIAIKVLRGKTFIPDSTSNELANASMAIECEVVSIEGKQVEADINVGNITVQEMVFDVKNGTVKVIFT